MQYVLDVSDLGTRYDEPSWLFPYRTDLSVASNGRLEIYDLIPGDYSITEIKSPNGYSLLKEPVRFTMDLFI